MKLYGNERSSTWAGIHSFEDWIEKRYQSARQRCTDRRAVAKADRDMIEVRRALQFGDLPGAARRARVAFAELGARAFPRAPGSKLAAMRRRLERAERTL